MRRWQGYKKSRSISISKTTYFLKKLDSGTEKINLLNTLKVKLADFEARLKPSRLTKLESALLRQKKIELWLKRDDLLHPVVSGNKWRKLKYNLREAIALQKHTLISMGGAYSNHLHALAYIGNLVGFHTIGIVRGEQPTFDNPTIADLKQWGMELRFISRSEYRHYRDFNQKKTILGLGSNQYWLPEGGANSLAFQGSGEIADEIDIAYDFLCAPCGTGATLAGLINRMPGNVCALGFPALKNIEGLQAEVENWLTDPRKNWQLLTNYHFGGFAKINAALLSFIQTFEERTGIPLDPVYTGKMLFGLFDLAAADFFAPGSRIVAIHTGGLQGKRGFK